MTIYWYDHGSCYHKLGNMFFTMAVPRTHFLCRSYQYLPTVFAEEHIDLLCYLHMVQSGNLGNFARQCGSDPLKRDPCQIGVSDILGLWVDIVAPCYAPLIVVCTRLQVTLVLCHYLGSITGISLRRHWNYG